MYIIIYDFGTSSVKTCLFEIDNTMLKLPFDKDFLASATLGALMIRMARYAVIMFLIMGVYPMAFPVFEKVGKKK